MIDPEFNVRRIIRIYSNETELGVGVLEMKSFDLNEFQKLFEITDPENPMYDCYEINTENLKQIEKHMTSPPEWNFVKFAYFIEAEST